MDFSIHFSFQIMILPWLRQKSNKLTLKSVPAQFFHLMVHKRFLQKLQQKCSNCRYLRLYIDNNNITPNEKCLQATFEKFNDKDSSLCLVPLYSLAGEKNMQTVMENSLAISSSWISVIEKSSVLFKTKGITNYGIVTWNYFGAS